jgi:hypothetical protein
MRTQPDQPVKAVLGLVMDGNAGGHGKLQKRVENIYAETGNRPGANQTSLNITYTEQKISIELHRVFDAVVPASHRDGKEKRGEWIQTTPSAPAISAA